MKKILTLLVFIAAIVLPVRAQNYSHDQLITLCDLVLDTPYGSTSSKGIKLANSALLHWAATTEDISLEIGPWISKVTEGLDTEQSSAMLGAYLASEIRYLLAHKKKESSLESVQTAIRETIGYYRLADGRIRETETLKKLSEMSPKEIDDFTAKLYEDR